MLNENAQKWVDALRSGEYTQCQHSLRQNNKYCCLGVACEVAIANGVEIERFYNGVLYRYGNDGELEESFLPSKVVSWLNLTSDNGKHYDNYGPTSLTRVNDHRRSSFDQIADLIESEPKGLFNVI